MIKLKQFEFTGYVKSQVVREGVTSEGYLLISKGMPVAAFYGHIEGEEFKVIKMGERAVKLIWVDSYDKSCDLEVRGRVDVDDFAKEHPEFSISIIRKSKPKTRAKEALTWGKQAGEPLDSKEEKEKRDEFLLRLNKWRKEGYVLYALEDAIQVSLDEAEKLFGEFADNIQRINFFKDNLTSMRTEGHQLRVKKLEAMFKNPLKITAIEASMEELREQIAKETEESEAAEAVKEILTEPDDAPKTIPEIRPIGGYGNIIPGEEQPEDRCAICGGDMKGKNECQTCGAVRSDPSPEAKYDIDTLLAAKETGLIPNFTFENFVVGENNRFSQAASLAVAKAQSTVYNPLFIYSGAGLGKTHVINAMGNYVVEHFPDKRVLYLSIERFMHEFIEATKSNKLKKFRNKYRKVDFLLLDDVHFLAGQEGVQDEMFHTFNTLHKDGKQIVMTSDRPISEITGLKERLVSRFESGLVTDMQIPDFETRVSILMKKSEVMGFEVNDDVLKHVARRYVSNIRKLEGALNKVIAYCELMNLLPSTALVDEILKDEPVEEETESEESPLFEDETKSVNLKKSHSYLIEEDKPEMVFELFVECIETGYQGMAISRVNPKRLKENHDFMDAQLYWLTDRDSSDVDTMLPSLEKIIYQIQDLLNTGKNAVLLIDGLDYLVSNTSFDAVLRFLRSLIDDVSESNAIFLMSLTPETLEEQELKILEREMEVLSY